MSNLLARLTTALAGRYAIERELGQGGMATVYLARDLRHERPVALKVLRPEIALAVGAERFEREIRLAAGLQHPHILTVHDSGVTEGHGAPVYWYSMPYVDGETLRDRLARVGQLSVDEAIRIAREAADALEYAHAHGVIHRDIKPENILLAGQHALLADFGIGKALSGASAQRLTETGITLGTPAYMSPEQASGDARIDERSDIYSLGAVLYEMLAGEPPFTAPTAQAVIARRFTGEVPSIRQARSSVPERVAGSVTKALALIPADRHASMAEFSHSLTALDTRLERVRPATVARGRSSLFIAGVGALIAVAALLGWWVSRPPEPTVGREGVSRLAVLPFENLGDSADIYFADGVTDAVRGKLTTLPALQVTASSSSNEYRETGKSPQQIGDELGVDYLLVGRVRWARNADGTSRVQLSPELIEVSTGAAIWQEPFDASLTDIFATQGDIAGRVATELGVALGAEQAEALYARPTTHLGAYDAYLRGEAESQSLNRQEPVRLRRAVMYYQKAVALDTSFALAWAQLSRALAQLYFISSPRPDDAAASRAAAARAYRLAPRLTETLIARGDHEAYVVQDAATAREAYLTALAIAPGNAAILTNLARSERFLGEPEAALRHAERAFALDPRSSRTAWLLGYSYLTRGRLGEAMIALDRGLVIAPTNLDLLQTKAMVHLARGDRAAAERIARTPPRGIDAGAYAAYFAIYWDLYWLLDEGQQAAVLALPVEPFDGNHANRSIVRAQILSYQGDSARARIAADSAQRSFAKQIESTPEDALLYALRGIALAYAGHYPDAVAQAARSIELESNAEFLPYFRHQLVRIHLLAGAHDRAIAELERIVNMEYFLTPGWLRVDPTFDVLRGDARFEAMAAGRSVTP